jgi:hypothetical protein
MGDWWDMAQAQAQGTVWQIAMKRNDFPVAPIGACTRARFGLCLKILCVVQQKKGWPSSRRNVLNGSTASERQHIQSNLSAFIEHMHECQTGHVASINTHQWRRCRLKAFLEV